MTETEKLLDVIKWAEGLIRQLPETHDGRNSWLLNHGTGEDVEAMRDRHPTYRKADHPAERYQVAEFDLIEGKWKLLAHGARYYAEEARAMKKRIEARSGRVMLLPC